MKRYLSLFIFILFSFLMSFGVVFAEEVVSEDDFEKLPATERYMINKMVNASNLSSSPVVFQGVSVNGSVATLTSTGSVAAYYVGTVDNVSDPSTYSVNTTLNKYYVGVKNGTYYFWVSGTIGNVRTVRFANAVNVSTSCNNKPLNNVVGTATAEMCYVSIYGSDWTSDMPSQTRVVSCAPGYKLSNESIKTTCPNTPTAITDGNNRIVLARAYCSKWYTVTCVPDTGGGGGGVVNPPAPSVADPFITDLTVSAGSLNPSFNSGNRTYTVNVSADTSEITIGATAGSGSSFVYGYGPKPWRLSYGSNKIFVKVQNSAGKVVPYTIIVNRADNRSQDNTLNSLTLSDSTLTPAFDKNVTTYEVFVHNNISNVSVGAVPSDSKAYFDEGFGPRNVELVEGFNSILIKVRSEAGKLKTYTINVTRESYNDSVCANNASSMALLNKVEFQSVTGGELIKKIDMIKDVYTYNIKVPYEIKDPIVNAFPTTDGDTFVVNSVSDLKVGEEQEVSIIVTSLQCPTITKTYTIGVTRQAEEKFSDNAKISDLSIENHKEFKFDPNKREFKVRLNKKETQLRIVYTLDGENATCNITGNDKLKEDSVVTIECLAEDQSTMEVYKIKTLAAKKGAPVLLIILVILIVIFVLIYLVLRLLGYRVYFNFSAIGAFFRELKEKITNKE